MTPEEMLSRFKSAFCGTVKLSELTRVRESETHIYYRCPCEGADHHAARAKPFRSGLEWYGPGEVLHCYEWNQQWLIIHDIDGVILKEEQSFAALMDRAEKSGVLGKRVTAQEAFRLHTERGIHSDLLDVENTSELDELMRKHAEISRRAKP